MTAPQIVAAGCLAVSGAFASGLFVVALLRWSRRLLSWRQRVSDRDASGRAPSWDER